jgi:hypothetical protein
MGTTIMELRGKGIVGAALNTTLMIMGREDITALIEDGRFESPDKLNGANIYSVGSDKSVKCRRIAQVFAKELITRGKYSVLAVDLPQFWDHIADYNYVMPPHLVIMDFFDTGGSPYDDREGAMIRKRVEGKIIRAIDNGSAVTLHGQGLPMVWNQWYSQGFIDFIVHNNVDIDTSTDYKDSK